MSFFLLWCAYVTPLSLCDPLDKCALDDFEKSKEVRRGNLINESSGDNSSNK